MLAAGGAGRSGSGRRTTAAPLDSSAGVMGNGPLGAVHADKASANNHNRQGRFLLIVTSTICRGDSGSALVEHSRNPSSASRYAPILYLNRRTKHVDLSTQYHRTSFVAPTPFRTSRGNVG